MKVRPLHDKVLIQRLDSEETTAGGIIIPDAAQEKPKEGKVIAIGKGIMLPNGTVKPLDVKKGDKVLFTPYGGAEISIDGEEYLILREDEIVAVID